MTWRQATLSVVCLPLRNTPENSEQPRSCQHAAGVAAAACANRRAGLAPAASGARRGRPVGSGAEVLRQQVDGLLAGPQEGVYGVDREGRATLVTPVGGGDDRPRRQRAGRAGRCTRCCTTRTPTGRATRAKQCPIYAAFRDGKIHHAEEVFWRKDGSSFPIEYTSTPAGAERGEWSVRWWCSATSAIADCATLRRPALEPGDDLGAARGRRARSARARRRVRSRWGPAPRCARAKAPLAGRWTWPGGPVDTTVLLLGESGTGKELVARAIHERRPAPGQPAGQAELRGRFPPRCSRASCSATSAAPSPAPPPSASGASSRRTSGTLFLDEVGELPLEAQAKLLRVLQEREFERVGGTRTLPSRVRIIAATNRDLGADGGGGPLPRRPATTGSTSSPSRCRRCASGARTSRCWCAHFLRQLAARLGRPLRGFSPEAERRLLAYHWPGNVRELENVVERAALLADGPVLEVPPRSGPALRAAIEPGRRRPRDAPSIATAMLAASSGGLEGDRPARRRRGAGGAPEHPALPHAPAGASRGPGSEPALCTSRCAQVAPRGAPNRPTAAAVSCTVRPVRGRIAEEQHPHDQTRNE